ncbi:MAG: helix-turn-helix domain-containing protein [Planctomycetota bacterium]
MHICRDSRPVLDPINDEALYRLLDSPQTPVALYKRALAISLLAQNVGPSETARRAGLNRTNLYLWVKRFREFGLVGLHDLPRKRKRRADTVLAPNSGVVVSPLEAPVRGML